MNQNVDFKIVRLLDGMKYIVKDQFNYSYIKKIEQVLDQISSQYVMEYAAFNYDNSNTLSFESDIIGLTLEQYINKQPLKRLSEEETKSILHQIWIGMNHLRGIAKSIKACCLHPSNIKIIESEIDDDTKSHLIEVEIMSFLPKIFWKKYSPEEKKMMLPQLLIALEEKREKYDLPTADLYSFACLTHLLMTGKLPFKENVTFEEILSYGKKDITENRDYIEIIPTESRRINQFISDVLINGKGWSDIVYDDFIKEIYSIQSEKLSNDTFIVEDLLGEGTYGNVYLVRSRIGDSSQLFALKEIVYTNEKDSFISREIDNMMICDHENILKLHGTYISNERILNSAKERTRFKEKLNKLKDIEHVEHQENKRRNRKRRISNSSEYCFKYLLMDYCDSNDLYSLIEGVPDEPIEKPLLDHILKSILKGLDYLHNEIGICHRDLKPDNILLHTDPKNCYYPIVRIGDFGLSKLLKNENELMQSKVGTEAFEAPEIANPFLSQFSRKCDMWSLGMIFYMLQTGHHAILRYTTDLMKALQQKFPIQYPDEEWSYYPQFREFVNGLLTYDPLQRFDWKDMKQTEFYKNLKSNQTINSSLDL